MSPLYDLLSTDATIVTPNQRLAQILIQQWSNQQHNTVTQYPHCYAYTIWLRHSFNQVIAKTPASSHPILIDNLSAVRLWHKLMIEQGHTNSSITLAENLYQAWCQCQAYRCTIDFDQFNYNHQTLWFAKLAKQFEAYLKGANLIVESQLADFLCHHANVFAKKHLIFACFDQLTPQQLYLFDCLTKQGIQIDQRDVDRKPAVKLGKVTLADTNQENQAWIDWLVNQHQSGKQSIAVILPNLQECAKDIQRLLRYHFKPEQFNISMGQSLLDFPLISQALVLLKPATRTFSSLDIRIFLTSPFIKGSQSEWLNRALLLETNRQLKQTVIAKEIWNTLIEKHCPSLHQLFQGLPSYPEKALPSEWANHFHQRLNHFGFPGDYGLTSTLYQCYEKWLGVLTDYAQFDRIESALNVNEAIELLQMHLTRTIFQPQSAMSTIQILGMLEAAGCEFDALWMAGLTDLTLPATGQLTPFIPIPLQQKLGMPYASQAKEYDIAQKRLNRFHHSCEEFVVSFAHLSDDRPNMPSPLISPYPELEIQLSSQKNKHPLNWQTYTDPQTIPLQEGESIRGGSRILANQAQCPFKAFAAHRLGIQDSEKAIDGLDNREKGTLIHLILQTIWQKIESQNTLNTMNRETLVQLINETINRCVSQVFNQPQTDFEKSVIALERHKLSKLILSVLEEDKKRPPFHLTAVEQTCQYDFEQFSIKLKFDRLDTTLEDGSKWIIDYKSTIPSGTPWLDDRPDDSQLLLYALLDEDIRTISYMQVQTGDVKHRGFAEHPPPIHGISAAKKKTWADYRLQWKSVVNELANEFSHGVVRPHPKKNTICLTCPYGQLCRYPLQTEDSE
ncbi:PD-(D/E)XK nuclease family protein [Legionella sp. W05-934-2]|uniref:PD-(D/E)XK nuclease family protein n=1 Tax=Legionella sp. W05-934-2 TaxID=1198649 RepID=UPI00346184FD